MFSFIFSLAINTFEGKGIFFSKDMKLMRGAVTFQKHCELHY